jgi:hypothetical protein
VIRWLVLLVAAGLGLLALLGVRGYRANEAIFDEVLTYEVTSDRPLTVRVPGGVEEVVLTSWAVVGRRPRFDPAETYPYGLSVAVTPDAGKAKTLTLDVVTRIPRDPARSVALGDFSARLSDSEDWLGDARTERLEVTNLRASGGTAVLRVTRDRSVSRVLVRLAYLEPLTEFERRVRQRSLRPERGRRMVEGRSSLGFADLPPAVRDQALSSYERRIPAVGRDGTDYVNRTVLIGHRLPSPPEEAPEAEGFLVGPHGLAALNFVGPVTLRVHGEPRATLDVQEGMLPAYTTVIGESGLVDLSFANANPRTVAIGAADERPVRFSLTAAEALRQIGRPDAPLEGQRALLAPDVRIQRHYRLDEREPVRLSLPAGLSRMALSIRAIVASGAVSGRIRLAVRGEGEKPFQGAPLDEPLPASRFDRAGGERVSVARHALVQVPSGVHTVLVTGSRDTLILPIVDEPGVAVDRLEPEYDVPLAEGEVFRHAPCLEKAVAAIRADNDQELDRALRVVRLAAQVRIEALRTTGPAVVERALTPVGSPLEKTVWRAAGAYDPTSAADVWTLLDPGKPLELMVTRARRSDGFSLLYRVPAGSLGEKLLLEVDGRTATEETIAVTTGRVELDVAEGRHRIAASGVESAWLFASAVPTGPGKRFKRQRVSELPQWGAIELEFERREDELLSVFVTGVSELADPPSITLDYEIDPGKPPPLPARLFHRVTRVAGSLPLVPDVRDRGLIWELESGPRGEKLPHPALRATLQLGDDLAPGKHVVRLRRRTDGAKGPLWVRAIVAGRRLGAVENGKEEAP